MAEPLPASVVIPTVGRPALLQSSLASVAACDPPATEVLVVDQSADPEVAEVAGRFSTSRARLVTCGARGAASARNHGLREASSPIVLFIDDDCRVSRSWVGAACASLDGARDTIVTGQVLPDGERSRVPSLKDDVTPRDYSGSREFGVLYSGNMAVPRSALLAFGGFDERFGPGEAAEDCDLCYRWLSAGHSIRYDPDLVVWHSDWRTESQLRDLNVAYWRGLGAFYAKHIRLADLIVLRLALANALFALRSIVRSRGRESDWSNPWRGFRRGLLGGFFKGLRRFGQECPPHEDLDPGMGAVAPSSSADV